jgi:DNA-binding transcriptional LysR family regulator
MIDELRALAIFAKVIELESFRAAACVLELSPSVVSHHVAALENRLGVTLIYRSTRQLSMTSEGKKLYISAKEMLFAAEKGLNGVAYQSDEPTGHLTITIPAMLTRSPSMKSIAAFAKKFPRVILSINVSDIQKDLIREGFDLAIRIGNLKDSNLKARKLFTMERSIVISPTLLAKYKKPRHPKELETWEWIGVKMRLNSKKFINKHGKTHTINIEPFIVVDNVDAVCQLCIEGVGLATPPTFLIVEHIKQQRLIEILPGWSVQPMPIYAIWPPNVSKESLAFRFINFLLERKEFHKNF